MVALPLASVANAQLANPKGADLSNSKVETSKLPHKVEELALPMSQLPPKIKEPTL
ncbi:hypothetical protein HPP92_002253 [Vanilla planifolia]|uniref:Uncharacterized protein n=1 Tax=Vanilla planifolia TaxID=51239 RepID=A0A835S4Z5_VANPL|nr:hypothetical protein HPP92_002253 [Vanilla planifolia]